MIPRSTASRPTPINPRIAPSLVPSAAAFRLLVPSGDSAFITVPSSNNATRKVFVILGGKDGYDAACSLRRCETKDDAPMRIVLGVGDGDGNDEYEEDEDRVDVRRMERTGGSNMCNWTKEST